jgi:hypothetical protein
MDSLLKFRSNTFIQRGEKKDRTSFIEQQALQIIESLAPVYRQGKSVLVADGMDAYTLVKCHTEVNAEIICLLWNECRDNEKLAEQLANRLKVKIR